MRTRGAIVRQAPGKYEVVDLELDDPWRTRSRWPWWHRLCHSDDHMATGDLPVGFYLSAVDMRAPESSRSGAGPRGFAVGDHVVFSFLALWTVPLVRHRPAESVRQRCRHSQRVEAGIRRASACTSMMAATSDRWPD